MAFCINCGQELAEGAKFCANCGKAVTGESTISQRKTVYEGNLHKCPNCGEVLNSFVTNCPTCGHEIRDAQGVSSVRQLAIKLEQLESKRPPKKGTNIFAQIFSGGTQLQSIDEQKIDLIRNFSIPNTKEDVLEFIVLAAANIDLKVYGLDSDKYQMPCRWLFAQKDMRKFCFDQMPRAAVQAFLTGEPCSHSASRCSAGMRYSGLTW